MANKSLINARNFVPNYFGNNREFQVFLRAINLAFSVIKSNTDNFIPNLLNPLKCKARLLPLLSNYVGWDYNPKERVLTNRWITKLYPILVHNRGNEIGITLAIALSICLLGDPDNITFEKTFSMEMDSATNIYGQKVERLRVYMYIQDYLPILKDLIEIVRPAGMLVEFIPANTISSSETISLTDEYSIVKYDYITGKLISINNVDICVQNSWELLVDEHAIKHYRWEHLKEFVWARPTETNSDHTVDAIEFTASTNLRGIFLRLEYILNNVEHYTFNPESVIVEEDKKVYTLDYLNDSKDDYYPSKIFVTVDNNEHVHIKTIVNTNDIRQVENVNNLLVKTFRTSFTTTPVKVLSDYTWGYLQDTGIEAYVAIPGLAPYDISNKEIFPANHWNTTNIHLTDGRFYDQYGNDLKKYVNPNDGHIMNDNGSWTGEFIKETRIYKRIDATGEEVYTGMYFDVSEPAKILNTYYKLSDNGVFSGYYLSKDNLHIYYGLDSSTIFKLIEENMIINNVPTTVWKLYDSKTNVRYNWHVDMITRKFIKDNEGKAISSNERTIPFSDTTSIGIKAFIVKQTTVNNVTSISATKYFVNLYGDVVDPANNIILSKKDRYKVSDSTMIGFSEVHDESKKLSTYDGTSILQREWSFMKDDHIIDTYGKNITSDFKDYENNVDPRYKFEHNMFDIGNPIREYTGTELIRFISNEELCEIKTKDNCLTIPLFVTTFDSKNASGELKIKIDLPENYSLGDVFKNLNIRYENKIPNDELNEYWNIYIDWVANNKNKSLFNLNELENPIYFVKKGKIEPRTLHWIGESIRITSKLYDDSTKVYKEDEVGKR